MPVKLCEIGEVCGAGVPVPGNLLGQVHADVAALHGERVLVEGGQERVVFGQHAAQPGVRPLVRVADVGHYLDDGPFPWGGAPPDLPVVEAGNQAPRITGWPAVTSGSPRSGQASVHHLGCGTAAAHGAGRANAVGAPVTAGPRVGLGVMDGPFVPAGL
jgi:hypothetical protein